MSKADRTTFPTIKFWIGPFFVQMQGEEIAELREIVHPKGVQIELHVNRQAVAGMMRRLISNDGK